MNRTLGSESEKFLIEYGEAVLEVERTLSEVDRRSERVRRLEDLRRAGGRRIKGLVAEFSDVKEI